MGGHTGDISGIPEYCILRDWLYRCGETYWGHPWYPGILSIKGLEVLVWGDILGTSLVSWDTKY